MGVTTAERYLSHLCDRSFLSLWTYPDVYRDQGQGNGRGDGKEVTDLLVVFEDHILILSDKACAYPASGDEERNWQRWYRRAVKKGADQVWGAERWIRTYPGRLYLDRACTKPFPFPLPDVRRARFHRIVVAHGASAECATQLGGNGSLMIAPGVIGEMHCAPFADGGVPFTIGQIDPARGYVHVFDDFTLDVVLSTLDTISDFVEYLAKKEDFITSGRLICAAGEEDLLAYYLQRTDESNHHAFVLPDGASRIVIAEAHWERFTANRQRIA